MTTVDLLQLKTVAPDPNFPRSSAFYLRGSSLRIPDLLRYLKYQSGEIVEGEFEYSDGGNFPIGAIGDFLEELACLFEARREDV